MHCHFRSDARLGVVLPLTARHFGRAIAMPNTRPRAVLTGEDVVWYRRLIQDVLDDRHIRGFEPLMTIEIRDSTTPDMVRGAHAAGAVAGKVYPVALTTNSDHGLKDFRNADIRATFEAMQDVGMLLLLHGEIDHGRTLVTEREQAFLPMLHWLAEQFPGLKIVLEHISTARAVEAVSRLGNNVAATITGHHLCLTLNDVIGDGLRPHNGCMPTPKGFDDLDALVAAAMSGNPKFFLGSDSAPHMRENKECARGACGVFTAPVLLPVLAEIFEDADKLDMLEAFTSKFGAAFYGLEPNEGAVRLVRESWEVPGDYFGIVPFRAGETLQWRIA